MWKWFLDRRVVMSKRNVKLALTIIYLHKLD